MAWEELAPPARAGKGETIVISTWKRGGLGLIISPELASRLKIKKGSTAAVAINLEDRKLRVVLTSSEKSTKRQHAFGSLKGAAILRLGVVRGLFVLPGKHQLDWGMVDAATLMVNLPNHKPKSQIDEMERAPVTPANTVLLSGGGNGHAAPNARPVPPSLMPRDARGRPIVPRAQDTRYQIPK